MKGCNKDQLILTFQEMLENTTNSEVTIHWYKSLCNQETRQWRGRESSLKKFDRSKPLRIIFTYSVLKRSTATTRGKKTAAALCQITAKARRQFRHTKSYTHEVPESKNYGTSRGADGSEL